MQTSWANLFWQISCQCNAAVTTSLRSALHKQEDEGDIGAYGSARSEELVAALMNVPTSRTYPSHSAARR